MKVWGLNEQELQHAATEVGVTPHQLREDGRALRFTLRPDRSLGKLGGDYKYQRTSSSGFHPDRKVFAVCWHGHRDFMLEVFKCNPEARIKTMWADYKDREDFLDKYEATGYHNVGSMMYPMQAREVCNCATGEWLIDLSVRPDVQVYNMRQSSIQACPHFIMVPEHYRADGTCKCNDPAEQQKMVEEWGYSKEDFVGV
jgi:hypothetical protein